MSQPHLTPPGVPSIHVRAALTWIAIFPLVAIGLLILGSFADEWHPVLRAFVLTAVIVPLTVYAVVPRLLAVHTRVTSRRSRR